LVNGADGIAVGMATKIPPHNLGETIDATVAYIDDPEIEIDDLMDHLPAPDFPTGGIIYGYKGVYEAYHSGRGRVVMRAKMHQEEVPSGRRALIVTEMPYQVNKSREIERIADRVRQDRIEGIADLRDESDRDGLRIVIELKRDANAEIVKNQVYKHSRLQDTFGVNMVALVNGRPKVVDLKDAIRHYVDHRHEIVVRRTEYDLRQAQDRAHILEGLTLALDHLDPVIAIIRHSPDTDAARQNLRRGRYPDALTEADLRQINVPLTPPVEADREQDTVQKLLGDDYEEMVQQPEENHWLTEDQANAILRLRLSRLTGLEREKIIGEYEDIIEEIQRLQRILESRDRRMALIKEELLRVKDRFDDERRTEIDYTGGDDIIIEDLYVCHSHDVLLLFTDKGQCFWLRPFEIPEGSRTAKGRSIRQLIEIDADDRVRTVINVSKEDFEDDAFLNEHYVLAATRKGQVKKTVLEAYSRPRSNGIIGISVDADDELIEASLTGGDHTVVVASSGGRAVHFDEEDARPMGRNTRGVRGMTLPGSQEMVGMISVPPDKHDDLDVLAVAEKGYGKRTPLPDYRVQGRGGKGLITLNRTDRTGDLVSIKGVYGDEDLMIITENGIMIRTRVEEISTMGRNTQGVRVINLKDDDHIADVTRVIDTEAAEEADDGAEADASVTNGEMDADAASDAVEDAE
ncbi:MAG: DNA gyrase subunit A, partial [Salinibacter sp.]